MMSRIKGNHDQTIATSPAMEAVVNLGWGQQKERSVQARC